MLLCQLVKLFRDGEPVRMSKRSGDFVTLREVVEEVGRDPIRFMMLYRKSDAPLDFDFAKVTEQSKDNPVFYVQYASARCHSVFRQASEQLGEANFDRNSLAAASAVADRRRRARPDPQACGISAPDRVRGTCARAASAGILPLRSGLQPSTDTGIAARIIRTYGLLRLTTDN